MRGKLITASYLLASAIFAAAVSAEPSTSTDSGSDLLLNVCIPVMQGTISEVEAATQAHLRRAHRVWFPQSAPRGLRQYVGPYPGISIVNITSDTCAIEASAGDVGAAEKALASYEASNGWALAGRWAGRDQVYCDPAGSVAASVNRGPGGTYDLQATTRLAAFCDGGGPR